MTLCYFTFRLPPIEVFFSSKVAIIALFVLAVPVHFGIQVFSRDTENARRPGRHCHSRSRNDPRLIQKLGCTARQVSNNEVRVICGADGAGIGQLPSGAGTERGWPALVSKILLS